MQSNLIIYKFTIIYAITMSKRPSTFEKNMAKANDIIYKAILKTKQTGDKAEDQEQNNAENSANNDKP